MTAATTPHHNPDPQPRAPAPPKRGNADMLRAWADQLLTVAGSLNQVASVVWDQTPFPGANSVPVNAQTVQSPGLIWAGAAANQ